MVLAFCWAHVRRDFIRVGKGWPQVEDMGLGMAAADSRALPVEPSAGWRRREARRQFGKADGCLRQAVAEMKTQMETELAQADLATPCRKVLESLQDALGRADPVRGRSADPDGQQHLGTTWAGSGGGRKNFYGSGSHWSGQLAAAAFSIFATLSMWKLNPRKWLTWYFEQCAAAGGKVPADIQAFLPWNLSEEKKKELGDTGLPEGDDTS